MIGGHLIKSWSSTQPSQTLSSGEAEMVGVTKGAAAALGFRSLLSDFGVEWPGRVWTDSSASIGMCTRQGIGKVRHMDTQIMWIQQRIRNNDLDLYKIAGEDNPADLMTKAETPHERVCKLLEKMNCRFEGGRAATAPRLRQEGGKKLFAALPGAGGLLGATATPSRSSRSLRTGDRALASDCEQQPTGGAQPPSAIPAGETRGSTELSELERLSQGGSRSAGWRWADAAEEEEARGRLHPAGVPLQVPDAPPEAEELPDNFLAHGEKLGSAGHGRTPLPKIGERSKLFSFYPGQSSQI